MYESVKAGFGEFMFGYFKQLIPTTDKLQEFCGRAFKKAVIMAPTRMIDQQEEMLLKYFRKDDTGELVPTYPHKLPIIFVAFAKDTTATGRDYTRQIADAQYITLPEDPLNRCYKVKTSAIDIRAQVVFNAYDEPSCRSLAGQFLLYLDETPSRRFTADYFFGNIRSRWPVQIESPDSPAMNIPSDSKNLTTLAVDLTLKCTTPLFFAPTDNEANDGQNEDGNKAGYRLVQSVPHVEQWNPRSIAELEGE